MISAPSALNRTFDGGPMTMTEPTVLRWETLTKRKFDQLDRDNCVVLVTCSPLEVHGPHLPFGADALEGRGAVAPHAALPARAPSQQDLSPAAVHLHRDRHRCRIPARCSSSRRPPRRCCATSAARWRRRGSATSSCRTSTAARATSSPSRRPAPRSAASAASAWSCIFSVLLKRLTGGSSELYDVLGQLPGVRPRGPRRRHPRRPGGDLAAARAAPGMGRARLREPAAPHHRHLAGRARRGAAARSSAASRPAS